MNIFYSSKQQQGFSIVELMIGIVIGLVLIAAASTVWVSSKVSYGIQNDLSEIQETGRFAIIHFQEEIRSAGFMGCANSVEEDRLFNKTSYNTTTFNSKFRQPRLVGEEGAATGASDAFTMRGFIIGKNNVGVADDESNTNDDIDIDVDGNNTTLLISINATELTMETPQKMKADQILGITDCSVGVIFEVENDMSDTDVAVDLKSSTALSEKILTGYDSDISDYNDTNDTNKDPYLTHLFRFYQNRYFISGNSLMRTSLTETEELLPGVENMQVLYGVDIDNIPGPDQYLKADAVDNWESVVSMKVALLIRSTQEFGTDTGPTSYDLLGETVTVASDRRRRKILTTEVAIRNWQ